MMEEFHLGLARKLREHDAPPRTRSEWERRRRQLLAAMRAAAGELPEERGPLSPRIFGMVERPGVRIERLTFESRPGVAVTANAYMPAEVTGRLPAVLCPHGHWPLARIDPVVRARCFGLARLGYFVLTLDAFGAGERGTTPGVAEYHGGLLGASLWPPGVPLWGLQLWDNVRALDYLCSRPEVDPERIGCTGASGGGNQTMYVSAFDARIRAAAPVCSVGTFAGYLRAACCVDEVFLGALTVAEEGEILGLVAPRALLVINATQDAPQFSVAEARKSLDRARPIFELHGAGDRLRHVTVESGHDYNRPMREAVYGWFDRWLRGRGDGSPVAEPEGPLADPDALRCFPRGERPASVATIVGFARERAAARVAALRQPRQARSWRSWQERTRHELAGILRLPDPTPPRWTQAVIDGDSEQWTGEPEPGITLEARFYSPPAPKRGPAVLLLHPDGQAAAAKMPLLARLRARGVRALTLDLRGTGASASPESALADIPDHNLCEHALWVGRPLMGQWVVDVRAAISLLEQHPQVDPTRIHLLGWGEAGLLALIVAALEPRIAGVVAAHSLASYVSDSRFHEQRMVVMVPDLLRAGDVPQIAALVAPRPLGLLSPVRADGAPAGQDHLAQAAEWPRAAYRLLGVPDRFQAGLNAGDDRVLEALEL